MTNEQITIGKYNLVQVNDSVCEVRDGSEVLSIYATIHEATRKQGEWNEDFISPPKKPSVTYDFRNIDTKGKSFFEVMDLIRSGSVPSFQTI